MTNGWKLDDAGQELLAIADQIAVELVRPAAERLDKEALFPQETIDAMRSRGLLRLVSSPDVGGHGQGLRTAVAVCERLARECASTAMVVKMHYCGTAVIEQHGNDELRRSIAEAGQLTTLAFSEYGSRSHFWIPVSTAERTAGGIALNASKQLITSAGRADIYIWSSRPVEADGLSTIWAVPADADGFTIPAPYDGLGLRGNSSAPIKAHNVLVP
ncbi:MAG: acyl-CoA dehydrogenase family protein, partial [Planctomycetales bacterium]|nr:acyl-CoA dehydrogenase family protein [Planctomycetales bacterium]